MDVVDCRGLQCPMPILKTRLALNPLKKGDRLVIFADDPTFSEEFARFCQLADIKLLAKTKAQHNHIDGTPEFETYLVELLK